MTAVVWAPAARLDLIRIAQWLEANRTPALATEALVAIRGRADFLRTFPRGGRPLGGDFRMLRVIGTGYLIVYRLIAATPEVVRVHHEREDWQAPF